MRKLVLLLVAACVVPCFVAQGAIVVASDTWDAAETWSAVDFATETAPAEATLTDPDTVFGESALGIAASTGGAPGDDLIFANDGTIAGNKNYTDGTGMPSGLPVTAVYFDFYTDQASGAAVSLYFRHDIGGDDVYWYLDITDITASGWHTGKGGPLDVSTGWYSPSYGGGGSDAQLLLDLADVDQIGILLSYQPNATQNYGIDNFQLQGGRIPEPGTYSMLGFAFLSLGVTFRKRLKDYWAQMMAQIKG